MEQPTPRWGTLAKRLLTFTRLFEERMADADCYVSVKVGAGSALLHWDGPGRKVMVSTNGVEWQLASEFQVIYPHLFAEVFVPLHDVLRESAMEERDRGLLAMEAGLKLVEDTLLAFGEQDG